MQILPVYAALIVVFYAVLELLLPRKAPAAKKVCLRRRWMEKRD